MTDPHLRRRAALRVIITALTLAVPAAHAVGAIRTAVRRVRLARYGRVRPVPGLPVDGEPLDPVEACALIGIARGWKQPAGAERRRP